MAKAETAANIAEAIDVVLSRLPKDHAEGIERQIALVRKFSKTLRHAAEKHTLPQGGPHAGVVASSR